MKQVTTYTNRPKKSAFPKKRASKKIKKQIDIKAFVDSFYIKYGEMMSKLSHE